MNESTKETSEDSSLLKEESSLETPHFHIIIMIMKLFLQQAKQYTQM